MRSRHPLYTGEYYGYISDEALLSLDSMEGIQQLPASGMRKAAPQPWPGYLLAALVAALAYLIHQLPFAPFQVGSGAQSRHPVSAAILAILGGVLVRNMLPLPKIAIDGAKRVARTVIPVTVVLTGAGLDLSRLGAVGFKSFSITLICIVLATFTAIVAGKWLKVWPKTALLIGAGTAICGTSAIVAVAPLIQAADEDLMLSIGTINILGLALMLVLPALGSVFHLNDDAFGVWVGTSIHAIPQVVAGAFAYSPKAVPLATLVKLVRVTLLAPFLFAVGLAYARRDGSKRIVYHRLIPDFVWGFLLLALMNTFALFPVLQFRFGSTPMSGLLVNAGEWLLTLSMAAMGLEVNVRFFAKVGGAAVLTGLIAAVVLCAASLLLIRLLL